jgi:hypothetical protein
LSRESFKSAIGDFLSVFLITFKVDSEISSTGKARILPFLVLTYKILLSVTIAFILLYRFIVYLTARVIGSLDSSFPSTYPTKYRDPLDVP